jgi:hypothetical protein
MLVAGVTALACRGAAYDPPLPVGKTEEAITGGTFGNAAVAANPDGRTVKLVVDGKAVPPDVYAFPFWVTQDPLAGWTPIPRAGTGQVALNLWDRAHGYGSSRSLGVIQNTSSGTPPYAAPGQPWYCPTPAAYYYDVPNGQGGCVWPGSRPSQPDHTDQWDHAGWTRFVSVPPGTSKLTFSVQALVTPAADLAACLADTTNGPLNCAPGTAGAYLEVDTFAPNVIGFYSPSARTGVYTANPNDPAQSATDWFYAPDVVDTHNAWQTITLTLDLGAIPTGVPSVIAVTLATENFEGSAFFDDLTVTADGTTLVDDTFEPTPAAGGSQGVVQTIVPQGIEAGLHLYRMHVQLSDDWLPSNLFDFITLDQALADLVAADPQARVLLDADVSPPVWWLRQHPGELEQVLDGTTGVITTPTYPYPHVSFASQYWGAPSTGFPVTAQSALRALVDHVAGVANPLDAVVAHQTLGPTSEESLGVNGSHVIGYWLEGAGQDDVEWWYSHALDGNTSPDYSAPMQKAYASCLTNYQAAAMPPGFVGPTPTAPPWDVTGGASAPSDVFLNFVDPSSNGRWLSYFHRCLSDTATQDLLGLAGVVKTESSSLLVGAYFGYLLEESEVIDITDGNQPPKILGYYHQLQQTTHRGLEQVLDSPSVDLVGAPAPYSVRRIYEAGGFDTAVDSIARHGKLWIQEEDIRTKDSDLTEPAEQDPDLLGQAQIPATPACPAPDPTMHVLDREFAAGATRRVGMWRFDMWGNWFAGLPHALPGTPGYQPTREMAAVRNQAAVYAALVAAGDSPISDVAVVVDEQSPLYQTLSDRKIVPAALAEQRHALGQMGAPYDTVHLRDVLDPTARRYKLYLFLDAFALSAVQRAQLQTLEQGGGTFVFVYAPGYLDLSNGAAPSVGVMQGLLDGMPVTTLPALPAGNAVTVSPMPGGTPWLPNGPEGPLANPEPAYPPSMSPGGGDTGANAGATPAFYVPSGNPAVVPLGNDGHGHTVLAKLDAGTHITVYSAVGDLPASLLRSLAAQAGVFLYERNASDYDSVSASRHLVSVHGRQLYGALASDVAYTGPHTLYLPPGTIGITEVSSQPMQSGALTIAPDGSVAIDLLPGQTRMFWLSDCATESDCPAGEACTLAGGSKLMACGTACSAKANCNGGCCQAGQCVQACSGSLFCGMAGVCIRCPLGEGDCGGYCCRCTGTTCS